MLSRIFPLLLASILIGGIFLTYLLSITQQSTCQAIPSFLQVVQDESPVSSSSQTLARHIDHLYKFPAELLPVLSTSVRFPERPIFVIGIAKSGTTTLCNILANHPQILQSSVKELNFFISGAGRDSWDSYDQYFRPASETAKSAQNSLNNATSFAKANSVVEKLFFMDCTIGMFDVPLTAARLHRIFPLAQLIVIARDPTERAYSEWQMYVRSPSESRMQSMTLGCTPPPSDASETEILHAWDRCTSSLMRPTRVLQSLTTTRDQSFDLPAKAYWRDSCQSMTLAPATPRTSSTNSTTTAAENLQFVNTVPHLTFLQRNSLCRDTLWPGAAVDPRMRGSAAAPLSTSAIEEEDDEEKLREEEPTTQPAVCNSSDSAIVQNFRILPGFGNQSINFRSRDLMHWQLRQPLLNSPYWRMFESIYESPLFCAAASGQPHSPFLRRGLYSESLIPWLRYYPLSSFTFLLAHELEDNTCNTVKALFRRLGLSTDWDVGKYVAEENWGNTHLSAPYKDMLSSSRKRLDELYEPDIALFEALTGRDLRRAWNRHRHASEE